jgi:hypothetical protein
LAIMLTGVNAGAGESAKSLDWRRRASARLRLRAA